MKSFLQKPLYKIFTKIKDGHKVQLCIIMRYCVELQVLDISTLLQQLEMTTPSAQLIITVRNDDRVGTYFGPIRLESMISLISLITCTSASATRTFL